MSGRIPFVPVMQPRPEQQVESGLINAPIVEAISVSDKLLYYLEAVGIAYERQTGEKIRRPALDEKAREWVRDVLKPATIPQTELSRIVAKVENRQGAHRPKKGG